MELCEERGKIGLLLFVVLYSDIICLVIGCKGMNVLLLVFVFFL